jgi:hypothetical protein
MEINKSNITQEEVVAKLFTRSLGPAPDQNGKESRARRATGYGREWVVRVN